MDLWCNSVGRFYLPFCIESEEIQCPDIKLSQVDSLIIVLHESIFFGELISETDQLCAGFGEPVTYGAILRVHVGLESSDVISGSRHVAVSVGG